MSGNTDVHEYEVDLLTRGEEPTWSDESAETLDDLGPVRSEEVPGIPDALLEQAVDFHTYD